MYEENMIGDLEKRDVCLTLNSKFLSKNALRITRRVRRETIIFKAERRTRCGSRARIYMFYFSSFAIC